MNYLTVDVGNSELATVLYSGAERVAGVRIKTRPNPGADLIKGTWLELLRAQELEPEDVALSISCVVPSLESDLRVAAETYSSHLTHWVGWGSPHAFEAPDSAKKEIGADLIAGLVGARHRLDGPLLVVDCGTATTLTLMNRDNHILGVAILPGLTTQLLSLTISAPHLPQDVSLTPPPRPYGTDTHEALQSGILYGHASAVEGLAARYRNLFPGESLQAIGCGGLYHRISTLCPSVSFEETELVNLGCRLLSERVIAASCVTEMTPRPK